MNRRTDEPKPCCPKCLGGMVGNLTPDDVSDDVDWICHECKYIGAAHTFPMDFLIKCPGCQRWFRRWQVCKDCGYDDGIPF